MQLGEFWRRLRYFVRREQFNRELDEEMRLHRELRAEWLQENEGLSLDGATMAARRRFGNATRLQEVSREMWSARWAEDFLKDVRFAIRQLRRTPGFTAIVTMSLALGIGANTAIFTLIDAVLLKRLPVRDPASLLLLGDAHGSGSGVGLQGSFALYSYDLYKHLQNTNVFDGLCAIQSSAETRVSVRRPEWSETRATEAKLVSGNYFDVLGVRPAMGRTIRPRDDSPSAAPVAVVSFRYWRDVLNSDPSVIGSAIDLSGVSIAIIGVAPPEFYGETLGPDPPSFWLPTSADRQLNGERALLDDPDTHWLYLIGRLQPNVSLAQAQARLTAALHNWLLAREGSTISGERRKRIAGNYVELTPAARLGREQPRHENRYCHSPTSTDRIAGRWRVTSTHSSPSLGETKTEPLFVPK